MHQRFRRLALFVGAASLTGAGLILVACGTDNGTPTPVPAAVDSGNKDTGTKPDTGTNPDPDGGKEGGEGGVDCSNNPTLRDNTASFRCAFKDAGGADASPTCTSAESCCNTETKATGPAFCATGAKDGTEGMCVAQMPPGSTYVAGKGRLWECADKSACNTGQICCMISDPAQLALDPKNVVNIGKTLPSDTRHPAACNVARVFKEGGSRCKAPAAGNCPLATDIKLCSLTDNNCGAGTTCTPFVDFTNFIDRGYCK